MGAIAGRVVGWIGSLLSGLVQYVGFFFAYRTGVRRERQRQAEHIVEVKDEQLEIAARPVAHRSDVLERMRNAGL
jgi:cbb3-type cytochrome oxidase subunit 3